MVNTTEVTDMTSNPDKAIFEYVFYNGGRPYKEQTQQEVTDRYIQDPANFSDAPFGKINGKRYKVTRYVGSFYPSSDCAMSQNHACFDKFDLCPAVVLWLAEGVYHGGKEAYFHVSTLSLLQKVADYYKLPNPITESMAESLQPDLGSYKFCQLGSTAVLLASVKFTTDGTPEVFKLYLYPHTYKDWDIWMTLHAVHNGGKTVEQGVSLRRKNGGVQEPAFVSRGRQSKGSSEIIYSEHLGRQLHYKFLPAMEDPTMFWEADVLVAEGEKAISRKFKSTGFGQVLSEGRTAGHREDLPANPPGFLGWVGYTWFTDNPGQVEYILPLLSDRRAIYELAEHYGLPYPCAEDDPDMLQAPYLTRGTHYQLPWAEEMVPISFLGVVFNSGGAAIDLVMYKFLRPWEVVRPLETPDLAVLGPYIDSLRTVKT